MKLASLITGEPHGRLLVVAHDLSVAVDAGHIAPSISHALARWDEVAPQLAALAHEIEAAMQPSVFPFDPAACSTIQELNLNGRMLGQWTQAGDSPSPFYAFW